MAADLIESLRAEGEVDSVGRFTLDPVKAREKLQKFQLVDAHRYVLELVQAAVLRGSRAITFDIDADDMHMRFDGAAFTAAELADLWGSIFADGDDRLLRGVRQLALGLNAALGLGPRRIVVRSGDQELRLAPGSAETHRTIEAQAETTIHVAQRVKLAGLGLFFKNLVGSLAEEVHLRERCVYATPVITLDGQRISRGPEIAEPLGTCTISAPGVRGLVAVTKGDQAAELRLVKDGVWIDSRELPGCGPGVLAIVEGDGLRKDVSLAKIVADETLAEVEAQVQMARWSAMARVIERARSLDGLGRNYERVVRAEVLRFMTLAEVPDGPDLRTIGQGLQWFDARTHSPDKKRGYVYMTLLDLAAAVQPATGALVDLRTVVAGEVREGAPTLRFADRLYDGLAAETPAIPFIHEDEHKAVARVLGCLLVRADELDRAEKRARARREFLLRTATGQLPTDRAYEVRGRLVTDEFRGQLGITAEAVAGTQPPVTGETTRLCREGCVLAVLKIDWGIPGLEVTVEGAFEPTDDHRDAVRDATMVRLALEVLAAAQEVLTQLVRGAGSGSLAGQVRGIVKAWLLLLFDAEARASLWRRLRVPKELWPGGAAVRAVLPGREQLLDGELAQMQLFEDFDGSRRSLDELGWRLKRKGHLAEIDRSVGQEPSLGAEVVWLGRGDRAILAGLFGADALQSWQPVLVSRQRERSFRSQRPEAMGAVARRLRSTLPGVAGEPTLWSRAVDEEGVQGVVVLARGSAVPTTPDGLRAGEIELFLDGRRLAKKTLDLGLGPILGAANYAQLRPKDGWDDVEDDEHLAHVRVVLARAAWALLAEAVGAIADPERWLAQLVVQRLAQPDRDEVAAYVPALTTTPLIGTITGDRVSIDAIIAAVREHGPIGWVLATAPVAPMTDPPVLRERRAVIDGLRDLLGPDALVEGDVRVRQREIAGRLATMQEVAEARLDPATVWQAVSLDSGSPKLDGQIGLSRTRTSGGLRLTLCTHGKQVAAVEEGSVEVACEAIVADPQLPLTAEATVDTRNKRYGQYVKRCRRAVYGLIVGLCERFPALEGHERAQARSLLLRFVTAERRFGDVRREARQVAWSAVCGLPLLVDVWGRGRTLAEVEAGSKKRGTIEAVRTPVEPPPGTESAGRLILRLDAVAEACVAGVAKIAALDHRWREEQAALVEAAAAPEFVAPDLSKIAWIDRAATIAGGLQAKLWIPREPAATDALVFTRGNKVVGRMVVFEGVGCAGVVSGEGLVVTADGVKLDERQRVSLAKQVCSLVEALARQVKTGGGRVKSEERGQARRWLVGVAEALERADPALLKGLGKPLEQLQKELAGLVSPVMRKARAQVQGVATPVVETAVAAAPAAVETAVAAAPVEAPAVVEVAAPVVAAPAVAMTPEHALLAAVRAELAWARDRHGSLLERLRLDRLAIGEGKVGIVVFAQGLVLQRAHPLVARQLARLGRGEAVDPVDLLFLVSAVYTRMNQVAEEIVASDEQAFVARMAEGLALAYR